MVLYLGVLSEQPLTPLNSREASLDGVTTIEGPSGVVFAAETRLFARASVSLDGCATSARTEHDGFGTGTASTDVEDLGSLGTRTLCSVGIVALSAISGARRSPVAASARAVTAPMAITIRDVRVFSLTT